MRTTEAARYARWSATIAVLLVLIVAGVYARRAWQTRRAQRDAPSAVPPSVQVQSAAFSYSKTTGNHTVFTVRASHATQFTQGDRTLLEDVWITVYGQTELRYDNLHTRACDYMAATGNISCAGDVQIDLESKEDEQRHPGTAGHPNSAAYVVHVDTTHLAFDQKTGMATTDQPVNFQFPQGEGQAVGLSYDSGQGELSLLHGVELMLRQRAPVGALAAAVAPEELNVSGSSLVYRREERAIHLLGPIDAHQGSRELVAGKLDVELDENLRAQRFVASDHPELRETDPQGSKLVSGDELSALVSPAGLAERFIADGHVHADIHSPVGDDHVEAERAEVEFTGQTSQPRQLTAAGNVSAQSNRVGGQSRHLTTSKAVIDFAPRSKGDELRIQRATTPAATLDSQGPAEVSGKMVMQRMRLIGQQLDATFAGANELRDLHVTSGVQFERQIDNGPWQTTTSRDLDARFASRGEWLTVDQSGDVSLHQNDKTAQGDRAHFDHASDSAVLTGSVILSDPRSRTTARSATFRQMENELHAAGNVVTNEIPGADSATNLASAPARISADRLAANTATGHAVYSGGARLWQGDSLVQAETIEVDRPTKVLTAIGHVHAVFPKQEFSPPNAQSAAQPAAHSAAGPAAARQEFWYAEAPRMTYTSNDSRAHLEGGASGHSDDGAIRADSMDLFFGPVEPAAAGAAKAAGVNKAGSVPDSAGMGGQQLVRASAFGNVIVDEEGRHGTSSRADYTAAEERFVLSGGAPTVHDSSGNETSGRQLTFFFGDDRINIDSAEGLRTRTLHRVEK